MSSIKTQFSVGLFVIIGFVIGAVIIIWLGMSHYLKEGLYYAAYFDESVQGLDTGSPVKYRGVTIGRVDNIYVAPDATLIEVILKIESGLKERENLVAQLKSVGITGIMFIELDRKSDGDPDLSPKLSFSPKYPVVSTKPSGIKQFFEGIGDLLQQFKELDIKETSDRFKTVINTINQAVKDAQIESLSRDMRNSLQRVEQIIDSEKWHRVIQALESAGTSIHVLAMNANQTVDSIDSLVSTLNTDLHEIDRSIKEAVLEFKSAMQDASRFMELGADLVDSTDIRFYQFQDRLIESLNSLEQAGENLSRFFELLSDQPSLLIFGKEPQNRHLGPEN